MNWGRFVGGITHDIGFFCLGIAAGFCPGHQDLKFHGVDAAGLLAGFDRRMIESRNSEDARQKTQDGPTEILA
jgi:hypothetical protein